jgi:hypothetical protein
MAVRKHAAKSPARQDAGNYTKPKLREKIKEQVLAGDKGGHPGQWTARKALLVAREYESQGGAYKHPRNETQKSLKKWSEAHPRAAR